MLKMHASDHVECSFKVDEDSQYISFIMLMSCDEVLESDDVVSSGTIVIFVVP